MAYRKNYYAVSGGKTYSVRSRRYNIGNRVLKYRQVEPKWFADLADNIIGFGAVGIGLYLIIQASMQYLAANGSHPSPE